MDEDNEDQELRLEALRLAVQARTDAKSSTPVVLTAKAFYNYIVTGAPDVR